VKVVNDSKRSKFNTTRPDTLVIAKSPPTNHKQSKLKLLDDHRFMSPLSLDSIECSSLSTSKLNFHGSYLTSRAALARKEAAVRHQAKRQIEAKHKYERLRSVSLGEIASQSCPLEDQQLSASMCLLPAANSKIWILSPTTSTSLGAFSPISSKEQKVRDPAPCFRPITVEEMRSTTNGDWTRNRNEQEKIITDMLPEQRYQNTRKKFQVEGAMLGVDELGEPTPESSTVSSSTDSGKEMLLFQNNEISVKSRPAHIQLPSNIADVPSKLLANGHKRAFSTSPSHFSSNQPSNLSTRRESDGSIFKFENVFKLSPRPFLLDDHSDAELDSLNPLKHTKDYNGETPPNSPLIVSQVAEQFI
jgi:hypothetical protein